jgi:16S rRNA (guanine966-N2)-methyltransferase
MPRIVGGTAGGRTIAVPRGDATRPTTDRVREALFSSLGDLTGLRGLEALSRGAEHALLVERSAVAVRVLRANVAALGLPGAAVHAGPLLPLLGRGPAGAYDLVLLDPPYDQDVEADLHALVDLRWLAPAAELVLERATRSPEPRWPAGLGDGAARARRYGETTLWYLRAP